MALDHKDIQRAIDGPPTSHVRNINIDTHIGAAPQRPYALLEDQMAAVTQGYRTVADLQAALAGQPRPDGLPAGAPDPNEVVEEGGELVRYVVSNAFRDMIVRDGSVKERIQFTKRYVALTKAGAETGSQEGRPTDYWNGFTWMRDGVKPERDFPVMMQQAALGTEKDLVFEVDAAPGDVARLRHDVARVDAARPPLPVETDRPASKEKK